MMMEDKDTLYFGYGANSQPEMMEAITGKNRLQLIDYPAILPNYELCVQKLDQVPDVVSPDSPVPISPRQILSKNWPKTFESYTIREASKSEVHGTIWVLNELERNLVRNWELVPLNWYKDLQVKVLLKNEEDLTLEKIDYEIFPLMGKRLTESEEDLFERLKKINDRKYNLEVFSVTEGLGTGQEIDRVVDGKNYNPWLNKVEDFVRIATKARKEYFERQ